MICNIYIYDMYIYIFTWSKIYLHGQSIAISHGLGPQKVAFWKINLLISGKYSFVKYFKLAKIYMYIFFK